MSRPVKTNKDDCRARDEGLVSMENCYQDMESFHYSSKKSITTQYTMLSSELAIPSQERDLEIHEDSSLKISAQHAVLTKKPMKCSVSFTRELKTK